MSVIADDLLKLANRVENEEPSFALECLIGQAVHNLGAPGVCIETKDGFFINRHGTPMTPDWEPYKPPRYLTSIGSATTLEPKDAQEIVVRKYSGGAIYVRITLHDGRPVYCETLAGDRRISEAAARTSTALRAMAAAISAPTAKGTVSERA